MSIQRFWILTGRKLNGEATPGELSEWETLSALHVRDQSPEQFLRLMERNWGKGTPATDDEATIRRLSDRLAAKMNTYPSTAAVVAIPVPEKRPLIRRLLPIAACMLVLLAAGWGGWLLWQQRPVKEILVEMAAVKGNKSHIILPDGTHVWLNADSRLSYNQHFGKDTRTVKLDGEAYFDVAGNVEHPFIIQLKDNMQVRVLGTSFNLRAYHQEDKVETSLISGSLEVQYAIGETAQKILLKPMQKLSLKKDSAHAGQPTAEVLMSPIRYYNDNQAQKIIREIVWKDNKLCFDAATFDQVAIQLERWFNVRVVFKDNALKQKVFTAYLKGESLSDVMAAMAQSSGSFIWEYDNSTRELIIDSNR